MADLQFVDEEQLRYPKSQGGAQGSNAKGMAGWLIKKGWVKNPNQAKMVLVVIALIGFAITIYNLSSLSGGGSSEPTINPSDLTVPPL